MSFFHILFFLDCHCSVQDPKMEPSNNCLTASSILSTCSVHRPNIPNAPANAVAPMPDQLPVP